MREKEKKHSIARFRSDSQLRIRNGRLFCWSAWHIHCDRWEKNNAFQQKDSPVVPIPFRFFIQRHTHTKKLRIAVCSLTIFRVVYGVRYNWRRKNKIYVNNKNGFFFFLSTKSNNEIPWTEWKGVVLQNFRFYDEPFRVASLFVACLLFVWKNNTIGNRISIYSQHRYRSSTTDWTQQQQPQPQQKNNSNKK